MKIPRSIRNRAQYNEAMKVFEKLIDKHPKAYTLESDLIIMWSALIEHYEKKQRYTFTRPSAIEAIGFAMENKGLTRKDVVKWFGDHPAVSRALSGERKLNLRMIKILHKKLDISFETLMDCKIHKEL